MPHVSSSPLDFRDPTFRADPTPVLAELRRVDPVHRHPLGMWVLTRHADVAGVNRDPRFSRDQRHRPEYAALRPFIADSPLEAAVERWMLMLDPPEHTAIRHAVARAFTPKAVADLVSVVERIVDEELDTVAPLAAQGQVVDLLDAVARPFPLRVIAAMLGLSRDQADEVYEHSTALAAVVEPAATSAMRSAANAAVIALHQTLGRVVADVAQRPPAPGSVLASLTTGLGAGAINRHDLIANLMLLFVAGHETTTNLVGNGLAALVRHPEQLALLRRRPDLLESAVEELLRFDPPANVNARVALEPVEIGGRTIRAGELVYAMLGAANRDPDVFAEPDRLDIERDPNPHVSFGGGIHFCLGATLARVEARVALAKILARWSVIELAPGAELEWRELVNLRGLTRLPLHVRS